VVVGLSQAVGALIAGTLAEHYGDQVAISGTATLILAYCVYAFRNGPEMREL
jgi:hypothetical protein